MFRIEHNVKTGEIIEIPLTAQEIKDLENMREASIKEQEILNAEWAEKEAKRQAVLDRLGITEEEARILLGGN